MLDILERLIAFDTVSTRSNNDIIQYISDYLTARDAELMRLPSINAGKSGLVATIGPGMEGGIVLSGHTDVVTTAGQNWTRPAFQLTREGHRLFGRGTTDMKGFLACMLDAANTASVRELRRPLKLVFSFDEEIGCIGIQEMKPALPPMLAKPRLCIIGEPTEMAVATGHKGKMAFKAMFRGEAGHSALAPKFVNALDPAADFVIALRDLQRDLSKNSARDEHYEVPYGTVHVGSMSGGQALNIVPDKAEMMFELRHLANDAPQVLREHIQSAATAISKKYGTEDRIRIEELTSYPGLDVASDSPAVNLAQTLARTKKAIKVAFGTEAGVFQEMGMPAIVCGPGSMSQQGHKPDESIELEQLKSCQTMLGRVLDELCA